MLVLALLGCPESGALGGLLFGAPPPPPPPDDRLVLEPPAPDLRASRVVQTPGAPAELLSVALTPERDLVVELRNTSDAVLAGYWFEVRLYDDQGHHVPNDMGWPTHAVDRSGGHSNRCAPGARCTQRFARADLRPAASAVFAEAMLVRTTKLDGDKVVDHWRWPGHPGRGRDAFRVLADRGQTLE
jgi:hypothetical protein